MPSQVPIWRGFVCRSCRQTIRHKARIRSFSQSARILSASTNSRSKPNSKDIDDYYALLLDYPLPTSTVTQRSLNSSPLSAPEIPPATSKPTPVSSSAPPPPPASVAERAKLVFGSGDSAKEKRTRRKEERDAQSTMIAGIRIPPRPFEPDNCCMSGCVNCVWDLYREELEEWAERKQEAQMKLHGGGATEKGRQSVTGGGMGEAALSMDDDGGGSETNWDPLDDGVGVRVTEGKGLFDSVPVGIREFMKIEKRLGQKRAEREAASNA